MCIYCDSPGMTSWPGGKVATVVAVCTPLVRLPEVSPSPTYWIRTFFFCFMRMRRIRPVCIAQTFRSLTKRGLAEMRLPFFSNSDRRGEGGGVAFWANSLFWGESSTNAARPPSLGPGASVTGRNTPTPCTWQTVKKKKNRKFGTERYKIKS